ncbi:MAG: chitobiase/beta-hexosaminidase C-terminal domain-containing protein [Acidobacteriota bacterium]
MSREKARDSYSEEYFNAKISREVRLSKFIVTLVMSILFSYSSASSAPGSRTMTVTDAADPGDFYAAASSADSFIDTFHAAVNGTGPGITFSSITVTTSGTSGISSVMIKDASATIIYGTQNTPSGNDWTVTGLTIPNNPNADFRVYVDIGSGAADGTAVTAHVSSFVLTGGTNGGSTDAAGTTMTIDAIAPITTATPAGGTYHGTQSVMLFCSDSSGAGCASTQYCVGSGCTNWTDYTAPIPISSSTDLRFFATDNVSNVEAIQTASYVIQHDVTGASNGNGDISCNSPVNDGMTTTCTLSPSIGYHSAFASSDTCGGSLVGDTYTTGAVTADCITTATFVVNRYTLTVSPSGTGSGGISGGDIDCTLDGSQFNGTCSFVYDYNTNVDLAAKADSCNFFKEWSGACAGNGTQCFMAMVQDRAVGASFELYPLVLVSSPRDGYDTIAEAYQNTSGGVIHLQAYPFGEDLVLGQQVDVVLDSGWNCDFTQYSGDVAIRSLTVEKGSVELKGNTLVIGI